MDPFSITCGAIGVVGVGGQLLQSSGNLIGNYRHAVTQIKHAQCQLEALQLTLEDPTFQSNPKCLAAQASFQAIRDCFPAELRSNSKRYRFRWAARDQGEVQGLINQLKETEISTTFALELEKSKIVLEMKQQLETLLAYINSIPTSSSIPQKYEETLEIMVKQWNTPLSNCLGAAACMILSKVKGSSRCSIFLRWHVSPSMILSGSLASAWSPWLNLSLQTHLRVQNVIPVDSPPVEACHRNNVQLIREYLLSGKLHPNDTTAENHTLLHLAIYHGAFDITQLLLDSGADPNLTFGRWETSPLNVAFYAGHVKAVRLLLDKNAELEYVNRRTWTSPRYIYDPGLTNLYTIELLDICAARGLDERDWNSQDGLGWTIFHRAAAFGRIKDLKKLLSLGASSTIQTFKLHWLPIFCAVEFRNECTFDFLANLILPWGLPTLVDSRGWNLLHFAAKCGSEVLMTNLLKRGLDPNAKTDESTIAVPERLSLKELIAIDIARFYNNEAAYERALKAAGYHLTSLSAGQEKSDNSTLI